MTQAHIKRLKCGGYNLKPDFKIMRETDAFAVVDGDNSFGPVSAMFCLNLAIKRCKDSGVYTVFSRNNNTFGPAFYYSLKAAEQGYIAFICSNSPAQMAPIGGKEKMLGTNPFAVVIPVPGHDPVIIDMATSVVAKSKFKQYKEAGKLLPNGVLSGAAYLNKVGRFYSEDGSGMNVGFYMTVIDPVAVLEEYDEIITDFINRLKTSKPGVDGKIILPGDDRIKFKKTI